MTGRRVWITRTEPGCSRQAQALAAAGYDVVAAPVLGVEGTSAPRPRGPFNHVFFLSEQAVRFAGDLSFCSGAAVYAIGAQTANRLSAAGLSAAVPAQASSEGLIQLSRRLHLAGKSCLVVAGEGGRKDLLDSLRAASARASEYLCYRRTALQVGADALAGVSHVLIASQDGFRAMARLWCESGGDAGVKVIAASDRIAALGPELGFMNLQVAAGAADADFIAALEID